MSEETVRLDRLDRRLLHELDINSRRSYADLSRTLRVPAETVRYRLNSLMQRKLIDRFITLIDSGKLGNTYYKVLLKLYNVSEAQVETLIAGLVRHDAVNWIARTDGIFDLAFTIRIQKIIELSNFLDSLKDNYRQYIHRITFAVNISVEFAVRDFLIASKRTSRAVSYTSPQKEVNLDNTDYELLRGLANDTRISGAALAEKVSLSTETVLQRIRRMERSEVIKRYTILPDLNRLGLSNYYVFVYLSKASRSRIAEFIEFCREEIAIVYFIKTLGEWDYELNIEVQSLKQYRDLMMRMTKQFSDIIRDYLGLPVLGLHKFTIAP